VKSLSHVKPQPHQVNLGSNPKYAEKLAEMEALLLSEMRRLDDPWRLWNQPHDGLSETDSASEEAKKSKIEIVSQARCIGEMLVAWDHLSRAYI